MTRSHTYIADESVNRLRVLGNDPEDR